MKIAICDDSYEFACQLKEKLESICAKLDWQMEATVFSSPTALLSADLSAIQVLFLDIDMPGLNGIDVHIVNNRVLTTKKNPMEHGYGLQNVASILERYDSIFLLNYNENTKVFSFSAQIPM